MLEAAAKACCSITQLIYCFTTYLKEKQVLKQKKAALCKTTYLSDNSVSLRMLE